MRRGRKAREDAEVVRRRVECAAMRLFANHGSAAVSVQTLANAVGMSKQAVLYHYGTKEAIRAAVLARVTERVHAHVAAFEGVGSPLGLEALTSLVFEAWLSDPYLAGVILREVLEDPHEAGDTLQTGTLPIRKQVQGRLEAAQALGTVRADLDAVRWFDRIALAVLATLALPPRPAPPDPDGEEAAELRRRIRETMRVALVSALVDPEPQLRS
jgi:TetR/AcrR family transcriptional regulator